MIYPPDIEAAESWGANCGPAALAAILELSMSQVRPMLGDFESRQFMNLTDVKAVLTRAGRGFSSQSHAPRHGLIFIQWGGHDHKPARAQYRFTHWIAIHDDNVFDINLPEIVSWAHWQGIIPALFKDEGHGDGTFKIRRALVVAVARK